MRKVVILETEVTVKLEVYVDFDPGSPDVNMRNPNVAACPGAAPSVTLECAYLRVEQPSTLWLRDEGAYVDIARAISNDDRESIAEIATAQLVEQQSSNGY